MPTDNKPVLRPKQNDPKPVARRGYPLDEQRYYPKEIQEYRPRERSDIAPRKAAPLTHYEQPFTVFEQEQPQKNFYQKAKAVVKKNKIYGGVGACLLMPSITTLGLLQFIPYLYSEPLILAFTILGNLALFGTAGALIGRYKPYDFVGRIFLTLVIIGAVLGIFGGFIATVVYTIYQLVLGIIWICKAIIEFLAALASALLFLAVLVAALASGRDNNDTNKQ